MKPILYLIIFAALCGGSWFGSDQYASVRKAQVAAMQVSEPELRATLDKAASKARQVLSYTTTPVVGYGKERDRARKVTASDFNGERFSEEQIQHNIDALPSVLNASLEEFKLTGATAYQSANRIEISELRGPPSALLSFMKKNEDIKEIRFATVLWDVQETTPVIRVEYDVWKPSTTPEPVDPVPAPSRSSPSRIRK